VVTCGIDDAPARSVTKHTKQSCKLDLRRIVQPTFR